MNLVQSSHEIIDHASEVRLRIRAASMSELLAEAGRALAKLQLRESGGTPVPKRRDIEVSASDSAALLAEWLNELIFLSETEAWVPVQFEVTRATETSAKVRASGMSLDRVSGLVKAATLHGLRVDGIPGGLEGEVILDV
ncbi:MAG TPA: archease [Gemmatimonadales bacterium]|jgi:SHS2 domain-containing protein